MVYKIAFKIFQSNVNSNLHFDEYDCAASTRKFIVATCTKRVICITCTFAMLISYTEYIRSYVNNVLLAKQRIIVCSV